MAGHRLLEHTADMGIEARAETLPELFVEAARGLREIVAGETRGACRAERALEVAAGDPGELLVGWLGEILYLLEIEGFFPVDFVVDELAGGRLRGRVLGEPFDPRRHAIEREVKAVTYHRLLVEQTESGWLARVYVDL